METWQMGICLAVIGVSFASIVLGFDIAKKGKKWRGPESFWVWLCLVVGAYLYFVGILMNVPNAVSVEGPDFSYFWYSFAWLLAGLVVFAIATFVWWIVFDHMNERLKTYVKSL